MSQLLIRQILPGLPINRRWARSTGPYYSVKLHCAMLAVMLSAAKHLMVRRAMLRCTQHDKSHGSFKFDRVLHINNDRITMK
ncbi:MAG: hypothetical protein ABI406_10225 [Ktedonobacteraceae bacterium]